MWFVYVVECVDGTLYTGITTSLQRRIRQHNGEIGGGAKYTRSRRPCKLVAVKETENRSTASKEEAKIKVMKRSEKKLWVEKWSYEKSRQDD